MTLKKQLLQKTINFILIVIPITFLMYAIFKIKEDTDNLTSPLLPHYVVIYKNQSLVNFNFLVAYFLFLYIIFFTPILLLLELVQSLIFIFIITINFFPILLHLVLHSNPHFLFA